MRFQPLLVSILRIRASVIVIALVLTVGCESGPLCLVSSNADLQYALENRYCETVHLTASEVESVDVEVSELPRTVEVLLTENERLRDVRLALPGASTVVLSHNSALEQVEVTSLTLYISGESPVLEEVSFAVALEDGSAYSSWLTMTDRTTASLQRLSIRCDGECSPHVLGMHPYSAPENAVEVTVSGSPLSHLYVSPDYVAQGIGMFSDFGVPTRSAQILSPQDPAVMASYEAWLQDNGFDGVFHGCVDPSECDEVEVPQ